MGRPFALSEMVSKASSSTALASHSPSADRRHAHSNLPNSIGGKSRCRIESGCGRISGEQLVGAHLTGCGARRADVEVDAPHRPQARQPGGGRANASLKGVLVGRTGELAGAHEAIMD